VLDGLRREYGALGQSDELGYHAASDPVSVHDVHATVLDRLGLVFDDADVWWKRRDASLTAAREALGVAACEAHVEAGRRMEVEAALRAAREELRPA